MPGAENAGGQQRQSQISPAHYRDRDGGLGLSLFIDNPQYCGLMGFGENGKRYQLHQPASPTR
jgi:hypothetical protein